MIQANQTYTNLGTGRKVVVIAVEGDSVRFYDAADATMYVHVEGAYYFLNDFERAGE